MRTLLFLVCVSILSVAFAEKQPIDRYQSIIDRQMFGEPPPGFDPTRPPSEVTKAEQRELSKEQEKLQSSISFSVINVTPQGDTMVGFSDNSEKPPKHYYLKVGEENGGWLVKEADPVGGTMTIQKDNIEVSLTIGGNSANDPNANSRVAATAHAPTSTANRPFGGANAARSAGWSPSGSLRQRRMFRQQQAAADAERRRQEAAEEAARQQEEAARQEEENAKRAAEREEMRANLLQVQEQLKKVREAKEAEKAEAAAEENAEEE